MDSEESPGGSCHRYGEGAPQEQTNTRARGQNCQNDDTVSKGWRTFPLDGNMDNFNTQICNRAELNGVTLGSSNRSPRVPGNRNPGRQDDNPEKKAQKSRDDNPVVDVAHIETAGGPCH